MTSRDPEAAADGYEAWLTEKLWELIPAVIRAEDEQAGPPGALRKLVEVIGQNAAEVRRSQDRLWDDAFIELADPWAVPYLGELVGTRLLQAVLGRAQRIDVAKTIYYRRRAGTPRVLEELIADLTGREGVIREMYQRLVRAPHRLDPAPPATGPLTGTPAFGLADLRSPVGAELAGTPFDELHHTPDLRRPQGTDGRYGIDRIGVHCYRLASWRIQGATPRRFVTPSGWYATFDPSGRDVPLFARRSRGEGYDYDAWRTAREAELPLPIRCRLLGHAAYELTDEAWGALQVDPELTALPMAQINTIASLRGVRIASDPRLQATLSSMAVSGALRPFRRHALAEDVGRRVLLDASNPSLRIEPDGATPVPQEDLAAGRVELGSTPPAALGRTTLVDPERGRFVLDAALAIDPDPIAVSYHYGHLGHVGAGPWDRESMPWAAGEPTFATSSPVTGGGAIALVAEQATIVGDNRTYTGVSAPGSAFDRLAFRAGDQLRPYVVLTADLELEGQSSDTSVLTLDGLWLGAAGSPRAIVLRGGFKRVEIRGCTLDPGGADGRGDAIHPVTLRVEGFVDTVVVQSSVVPRIALSPAHADAGVETVCIADSILDAQHVTIPAGASPGPLDLDECEARLQRVTVLGRPDGGLRVHRLWATDSILADAAEVFDTQNGCFRFSAAHEGSRDHLPHPYESAFFSDPAPLFVSRRFGDPGYGQLSDAPVRLSPSDDDLDARASIVSGAEDDGEMGAFHDSYGPLTERALRAKYDEYMPFGLLPFFSHET